MEGRGPDDRRALCCSSAPWLRFAKTHPPLVSRPSARRRAKSRDPEPRGLVRIFSVLRFATLALGPGSRSARTRALAALARDTERLRGARVRRRLNARADRRFVPIHDVKQRSVVRSRARCCARVLLPSAMDRILIYQLRNEVNIQIVAIGRPQSGKGRQWPARRARCSFRQRDELLIVAGHGVEAGELPVRLGLLDALLPR
jgi:hypothetical protein